MPGQFDNILDLFAKNRNSKEVEEGYEYKGYIIQIGQGDKDRIFVIDPNSEDDKIVGEFSTEDEALEWIDGDDLEESKKVKTEAALLNELVSESGYRDPIRVFVKTDLSKVSDKQAAKDSLIKAISETRMNPEILVDNSDGSFQIVFPGKGDWASRLINKCSKIGPTKIE